MRLLSQMILQEGILYNWLFFLGENFPEWWALSFSRNFPDLKMHGFNYWKISRDPLLHKLYINEAITCHTHAMNTIIIIFYLYLVTTCMCTCTGVIRNSWSVSSICAERIDSLVTRPFLMWGIYCLQYKHLYLAMPRICILVVGHISTYVIFLALRCTKFSSSSTKLHVAYNYVIAIVTIFVFNFGVYQASYL